MDTIQKHRSPLAGKVASVGERAEAVALPQHQERVYLVVTKHSPAHRGRRRPPMGLAEGVAGVGQPGQELSCSPGLSDPVVRSLGPQDRGCREVEGSRERERMFGI